MNLSRSTFYADPDCKEEDPVVNQIRTITEGLSRLRLSPRDR